MFSPTKTARWYSPFAHYYILLLCMCVFVVLFIKVDFNADRVEIRCNFYEKTVCTFIMSEMFSDS